MMTFPTEWTNKCSKPPTRHSVGSKYINISAGPETKQVKHPFPLEESDVSMYIYIYMDINNILKSKEKYPVI